MKHDDYHSSTSTAFQTIWNQLQRLHRGRAYGLERLAADTNARNWIRDQEMAALLILSK